MKASFIICMGLIALLTVPQSVSSMPGEIHVRITSVNADYSISSHVHVHEPQYEFMFSFEVLNEANEPQELSFWTNMMFSACKDPAPISTNASFETKHSLGTGATCTAAPKLFDHGVTTITGKIAAITVVNASFSAMPDDFYYIDLESDNGLGSRANITVESGEAAISLPSPSSVWSSAGHTNNDLGSLDSARGFLPLVCLVTSLLVVPGIIRFLNNRKKVQY